MNIPARFWTTLTTLGVLLVVFVALLSLKTLKEVSYVGSNPDTTATINVDGTGDAVAVPDVATFSFSVTENAKTVAEAQTAATTKINNALKTVRDAGVSDKDISTESYNISPHYEYRTITCAVGVYCAGSKSVLDGYDVSQTIQVKIRDLSKAGTIFTSIGSLNVQNVNSLSFSVDKPESVQADARGKAIADAQAKADVLAKTLGVKLVRVISFSENNNYPRPYAYAMAGKVMAQDSAPATPPEIPTGETKITSNVSITYEIR